uniref:Ig-like domain-containing protein n=1 Tax=Esox lucius TaxID=8010 RepID=A0A6Q2X331_ESOLU
MDHTWPCVLLLLNTLIYCGHSQGIPAAVLTLQPNWPQIFMGESVTMICNIQEGDVTDWTYTWRRTFNNGYTDFTSTENKHQINATDLSVSGDYTCLGRNRHNQHYSMWSNRVRLTVTDQPKAVLSFAPQWMNPGDSVTLNCEFKESSTGWRFSWYKTVPYRAGLPSLLDKSYSVEPLSGYGTTEESYTLSSAGPTDTGGYVCRAGRGDPVYYTDYSQPQFLWSGDLQSSVSVRISPNRTQHFTSKSLSLICDLKGNSTGWRLMRYTETGVESGCSSNWGSITGSTCTITSTVTWDSGVYWCESGSGQYSNAVNITVSDGDVILESPAHLVNEGDSLTLRCKCRNQRCTNSKVDFYRDGVLIRNETTGEMTISAVMKSDEGFYKCKSDEIESSESWVTVRVPVSSTSVLVGVVVRLVFAGVLLTIILVLLCRHKIRKGGANIPHMIIHTDNNDNADRLQRSTSPVF